ncbi:MULTISPECIES: hypothetical protein [Rhodopseudomonas]|uniref:hypothetical protein n=1 Tax=Rhodopseudomonas TaxID=1073 RepID=UPI000DF1B28B|nr:MULTISPECIES: hypothetical protein [Rhodopseudomonas]
MATLVILLAIAAHFVATTLLLLALHHVITWTTLAAIGGGVAVSIYIGIMVVGWSLERQETRERQAAARAKWARLPQEFDEWFETTKADRWRREHPGVPPEPPRGSPNGLRGSEAAVQHEAWLEWRSKYGHLAADN